MDKRFCSVIRGPMYFLCAVCITVFVVLGLIFIPDAWESGEGFSSGLFIVAALIGFPLIIGGGCLNFVRFTRDGVFHKNGKFDWETLHITGCIDTGFGHSPFHYYFYFSDQALNYVEAAYARKMGLYLQMDKKRLDYFLSIYKREIHIIDTIKPQKITKSNMAFLKEIAERVEGHNNDIKSMRTNGERTNGNGVIC